MNSTPNSSRKHIAIFGKTNSGKSSLINAITGQAVSVVSAVKGTTTDPVSKAMELLPFGPVVFIDTAGLDDSGEVGNLRVQATLKVLQKTDFALLVIDINDLTSTKEEWYSSIVKLFERYNIPYLTVVNKVDTVTEREIEEVNIILPQALVVSAYSGENISALKEELINRLSIEDQEVAIVGDLLPKNGTVIMVVPIDSEAPKGRLILPQVQLIRDCLDHGVKSYVVRDTELESALRDLKQVDLVITDSQAFKKVAAIVPQNIKLTSFSILFARYKGDLKIFLKGIQKVKSLTETSKILIAESCTHNTSHEDIGRVKIPNLLRQYTGKNLSFTFYSGQDFPQDLETYDLVIHCGSCMLNRKSMQFRLASCIDLGVPITNYGILLAHLTGILERSVEIFQNYIPKDK